MTRLDPIIAVKDAEASANWYQKVFGFTKSHGGEHFSVLASDGEITLCLHRWQSHDHPTMNDPSLIAGNGLMLYFRTESMNEIYRNALEEGCLIEEDVHLNPNSLRRQFSLRDPDGYFLTISEFHRYEG